MRRLFFREIFSKWTISDVSRCEEQTCLQCKPCMGIGLSHNTHIYGFAWYSENFDGSQIFDMNSE